MKNIKEILKSEDPEEIKKEIKERGFLMSQMVGKLYPEIVFDEIVALRKLYIKLTEKFDY